MKRILAATLLMTSALSAQVPGSGLALETKAWVTAKVYDAIRMYYAHAEGAPALNLDRDYQQYLKDAFAAGNRYDFDLATLALFGKLRNGHSDFHDSWLAKNYGQPLGFWVQSMPEGWVVISSNRDDLNPGDIAVSIDGKPMDTFFAEREPMIAGSSETARRRILSGRTWLWPQKFDLALANGKHIAIDRQTQKLSRSKGFPFPQTPPALPPDVKAIRIHSFEDPKSEKDALAQLKNMMNAKAILFDVRGNTGGSTPSDLINALLDRPWQDFRFVTPLHIAHIGAQQRIREAHPEADADPYTRGYLDAYDDFKDAQVLTPGAVHAPAPGAYKGKIIILTDGDCASACEDFVEPFKASGRGTIVGEATFGSSGQPYLYDFGNGMTFRISSKRYYMPDSSPFEGQGIKPDIGVIPSLADLKAGRDPVLAKALQLAAQ